VLTCWIATQEVVGANPGREQEKLSGEELTNSIIITSYVN